MRRGARDRGPRSLLTSRIIAIAAATSLIVGAVPASAKSFDVHFLGQSPEPGETYVGTPLAIFANYTFEGDAVPARTVIILDGRNVTSGAAVGPNGFFVLPPRILEIGKHNVTLEFYDEPGEVTTAGWEFTVRRSESRGGLAPELAVSIVWLLIIIASIELLGRRRE
ncbi:MAG: hypothetical protein HY556_08640 [Euryarchaeota archaeon]|nr:hypothetical protein [Euryarchaeota archaeon]